MPSDADDLLDGPPPAYQRCPVCSHVIATLREWHNHRRSCFEQMTTRAYSVPGPLIDQTEKNEARARQRRIEKALA